MSRQYTERFPRSTRGTTAATCQIETTYTSDKEWLLANHHFFRYVRSAVFSASDPNVKNQCLVSGIYNYFSETCGTYHKEKNVCHKSTAAHHRSSRRLRREKARTRKELRSAARSNLAVEKVNEFKRSWFQLIRSHNKAKRSEIKSGIEWQHLRDQEAYANNFWEFTDNLFVHSEHILPDCSIDSNIDYFSKSYSNNGYDTEFVYPDWLSLSSFPTPPFNDGPITFEEVSKKVKKSRSKSSPSPLDGVGYVIYKRCPALWPALLDLFNCCWSTRSVPPLWKRAVNKLIPKPSASMEPSNLSNFRPIALTPDVDKLYTDILKDRWIKFMTENHYWSSDIQKASIN